MSIPNFISVPLTTAACCTCAKWEGARVLLDGYCHSLPGAVGGCRDAFDDGGKEQSWQVSMKPGSITKCGKWNPAE